MSKIDGINNAIKLACDKLATVDLKTRTCLLGLVFSDDNRLDFNIFGNKMSFYVDGLRLLLSDGKPAKPSDHLILLHYLLCDVPVKPTGRLISYRDFPGGQFYYQPFLSRTVNPLLQRFGNNIEGLKKNLSRFEWRPAGGSDFSAIIHVVGCLEINLIYRLGDSEFSPDCEVLFDSAFKRVYGAEDAAYAASRICLGLL